MRIVILELCIDTSRQKRERLHHSVDVWIFDVAASHAEACCNLREASSELRQIACKQPDFTFVM
ncbi:hypothetical protein WJ25_04460 [Burkholderia thailandensis]|nr:hypothetical protein WJ25_04460 [Burkholderia thailandensis]